MISSAIVFGAGSWGTALASTLAQRGLKVQFWGRDAGLMEEMGRTRRNSRYLPGLQLDASIRVTSRFEDLEAAELLVFVVPSRGILEVVRQAAAAGVGGKGSIVLSCTKGIELDPLVVKLNDFIGKTPYGWVIDSVLDGTGMQVLHPAIQEMMLGKKTPKEVADLYEAWVAANDTARK